MKEEAPDPVLDPVLDPVPDPVSAPVIVRAAPSDRSVPLVFSSPHSGRRFPPDFASAVPVEALLGYEDRFVDDLIVDAPAHGISVVEAAFPRAFIDPNRAPDDLDRHVVDGSWTGSLAPTAYADRGIGLVFRSLPCGTAIYDRPLTQAELKVRLEAYWEPFHDALAAALDAAAERCGRAWHVDWHSMRPEGDALAPDPGARRPHFVVSDRHGTTCGRDFTECMVETLRALGHSVAVNEPFAGGYVVARHGAPERGRHSLQVEINRGLYLDMATLERGGGFAALRADLATAAARLAAVAAAKAGAAT